MKRFSGPAGMWIYYKVLWLALTGCLLGAFVNALRGEKRIPWREGEAILFERRLAEAGLAVIGASVIRDRNRKTDRLLDVRSTSRYRAGRIPGAVSFPAENGIESLLAVAKDLLDARWIVVYCDGLQCDDALRVGCLLRDAGFKGIYIYAGGFDDWVKHGGKLERGEPAP